MIWWLPIVLALPAYFLWCVCHEGAHALVARVTGRKILEFKPYPHKYEGNFRFAGRFWAPPR
jgi:hypothetical protein